MPLADAVVRAGDVPGEGCWTPSPRLDAPDLCEPLSGWHSCSSGTPSECGVGRCCPGPRWCSGIGLSQPDTRGSPSHDNPLPKHERQSNLSGLEMKERDMIIFFALVHAVAVIYNYIPGCGFIAVKPVYLSSVRINMSYFVYKLTLYKLHTFSEN